MNRINVATLLFKSEKKTGEGHLKQMRKGLRNNLYFFYLAISCELSSLKYFQA